MPRPPSSDPVRAGAGGRPAVAGVILPSPAASLAVPAKGPFRLPVGSVGIGFPALALALTLALILGWPGQAPGAMVTGVSHLPTREGDVVQIELDAPAEPQIRFSPLEACWQVDLIGVERSRLATLTGPFQGPVLGIRQAQIHDDPPIQRVSVYTVTGARVKVARRGSLCTLLIRGAEGGGDQRRPAARGLRPQPLMHPGGVSGGEVIIDVRGAPPLPLITQLAAGAGIDLRFRDPLPDRVTLDVRRPTSLEALQEVAAGLDMVLTNESDGWWLTARRNPLLDLPAARLAATPAGHSGRSVAEAIRRLDGGDRFLARLGAGLPPQVAVRPSPEPAPGQNSRTYVQHLLESHGIHLASR
ncbi:MAG: hypothetical protein GX442_05665 [Candidatus Riflebacteria bacterium]|nr:hypothetical protein [Candidatus Riflebacteria bacterium]